MKQNWVSRVGVMSVTFQGRRFFQNAVSSRSQINKIDKSIEEIE